MVLDRFSAYLLLRRHLRLSASRNQALLVEAIMEDLAARRGQDPASWGVLGLLSQLDLEYAAQNPAVRGRAAREQAELEGLAPDQARALERWCEHLRPAAPEGGASAAPAPLEDALLLASSTAEELLAGPGPTDPDRATSLGRSLELRRQQGDALGDRLDRALESLGLGSSEMAELVVASARRVSEDLR